ncbi:MAG: TolC family protein [Nitrospiria bacterium]
MKKLLNLTLVLWLMIGAEIITLGANLTPSVPNRMTLKEAIDLALHQNPNIKYSVKTYEVTFANIGVTRSGLFPQIQTSVNYTRSTANFAPSPGLFAPGLVAGPESYSSLPNYSTALSFNQLLYDFGQLTAEVHSMEKLAQSADTDVKTAMATLILNVKEAYYGLVQDIQIQQVDEETVHQMQKHLEQAEGFFKVGSKPKFDVTKAQIDLTNARLTLIKGKNDVQVARVTLNNAMGLPVESRIDPEDQLVFKKEEMTLDEAQRLALERRPELASARLKKESGLYQLEFTKHQFFPTLTASGSYFYRNDDFPLIYNWNVGATINFPIFNGFQTTKLVDQAQANVEVYSAQEEIEIQNILLEVQQAYLNLVTAEEEIAMSELVLRQATENLDLAEGRYKAGVGIALETTDAEVSLSSAKTTTVQALYNFNVAEAQLQKAIGVYTP